MIIFVDRVISLNILLVLKKVFFVHRLGGCSSTSRINSIDWTLCSSTQTDPVTSDVVAPSPWTIFGCQNGKNWNQNRLLEVVAALGLKNMGNGCNAGLRLFKEAKDRDSHGKVGRCYYWTRFDYKKHLLMCSILSSGTIILLSWLWVLLMALQKPSSRHSCLLVPQDQSKFFLQKVFFSFTKLVHS